MLQRIDTLALEAVCLASRVYRVKHAIHVQEDKQRIRLLKMCSHIKDLLAARSC